MDDKETLTPLVKAYVEADNKIRYTNETVLKDLRKVKKDCSGDIEEIMKAKSLESICLKDGWLKLKTCTRTCPINKELIEARLKDALLEKAGLRIDSDQAREVALYICSDREKIETVQMRRQMKPKRKAEEIDN